MVVCSQYQSNFNSSKQSNEPTEFLAFICILFKGREKLCLQGAIIFGLASQWLKNWLEISKPIAKRGNRSRVVTFHARMKSTQLNNHQIVSALFPSNNWDQLMVLYCLMNINVFPLLL